MNVLIKAIETAKQGGKAIDVVFALKPEFVEQCPEGAWEIAKLLIVMHRPQVGEADDFHLWCAEQATQAQ